MNKFSRIALVAAATLGFTAAASASADQSSVDVQSVPVSFSIEEASSAQGARTLFNRIRKAADEVCRISPHPRGHELWVQHECEARAVEQAVRQTNLPALNEIHERRSAPLLFAGN